MIGLLLLDMFCLLMGEIVVVWVDVFVWYFVVCVDEIMVFGICIYFEVLLLFVVLCE